MDRATRELDNLLYFLHIQMELWNKIDYLREDRLRTFKGLQSEASLVCEVARRSQHIRGQGMSKMLNPFVT